MQQHVIVLSTIEIGTDLTQCQQEYLEGRFQPLCTPEGSYEDTQCQGTACFCVNERGDEIARSRTELPAKPNCTAAGTFTSLCVRNTVQPLLSGHLMFIGQISEYRNCQPSIRRPAGLN